MKKIICVLLVLLIAAGLFGCKRTGPGDGTGETTTGGEEQKPGPYTESDTNVMSTYGRMAYADGCTYFVTEGMLGDAEKTGGFETEDIYRIKDGSDAPELLLSVPQTPYDGIARISVTNLTPYGDYVYFCAENLSGEKVNGRIGGNNLYRTKIGTGEYTVVAENIESRNIFNRTGNRYGDTVYLMTVSVNGDTVSYGYIQVDLKSGAVSEFKPDLGTTEPVRLVNVCDDGYVYFFKLDAENHEPYGVFRTPLAGGKCEDVVAIGEEIDGAFVSQGHVFIVTEDKDDRAQVYDVNTGEKTGEFPFDDDKAFNVCGDTVYYIKDESELCSVNIDGSGERQIAAGRNGFDLMLVGVAKECFILIDEDMRVYKMNKDGRILPGAPVVKETERPEEKTDGEGFTYYEWPNAVEITGYNGDSKTVSIPDSENGKPVRKVTLMGVGKSAAERIIVPEGVYSAVIYSSRTVTQVDLPSSLGHMNYRGFPYSFECAEGCVFRYNGTKAKWQELYDFCREYHNCTVDTYGTRSPVVQCADGVWELPENN